MPAKRGIYSIIINGNKAITVPWDFINNKIDDKEYKLTKKVFNKKEKYPLTVIDSFTTQFYTEDELKYALGKTTKTIVNQVEIIYKENGEVRNASIAYKKQPEISSLACNNFGSYEVSEVEQDNMIKKLFSLKQTHKYIYEYLIERKYICKRLENCINECYFFTGNKESEYNYLKKRLRACLNYKACRNIYMGIQEMYDLIDDLKPINPEEYTVDPDEQMAILDGHYPTDDDFEPDIYDRLQVNENNQYIMPLERAGYTKTLKR